MLFQELIQELQLYSSCCQVQFRLSQEQFDSLLGREALRPTKLGMIWRDQLLRDLQANREKSESRSLVMHRREARESEESRQSLEVKQSRYEHNRRVSECERRVSRRSSAISEVETKNPGLKSKRYTLD